MKKKKSVDSTKSVMKQQDGFKVWQRMGGDGAQKKKKKRKKEKDMMSIIASYSVKTKVTIIF